MAVHGISLVRLILDQMFLNTKNEYEDYKLYTKLCTQYINVYKL